MNYNEKNEKVWGGYQRDESTYLAKPGANRCVITDAREATSKTSGKPMIVVTVTPSSSTAKVKCFFVEGEYFNKKMTQFFDAFPEIEEGNFDFDSWVGSVGAAFFGVDDRGYLTVKYFLKPDKAKDLPPFVGEIPPKGPITFGGDAYIKVVSAED